MNLARPKDVVKYIHESIPEYKSSFSVGVLKSKSLYYDKIGIEFIEIPDIYEIDIGKFYTFCNRQKDLKD
jgi:hypothetical protein